MSKNAWGISIGYNAAVGTRLLNLFIWNRDKASEISLWRPINVQRLFCCDVCIFKWLEELVLQKTQNKVKIDNIDQWTSAFIVFISIFCKVHVSRFQELLKYLHTVRLGASRSTSLTWKLYDEQYRLRKVQNTSSSWACVDTELWLAYMSPSSHLNMHTSQQNNLCTLMACPRTGCVLNLS
jgi:hypothetical protein